MPSLLVVEDNTDLRTALVMLFRAMGWDARGAGSSSEGFYDLMERDIDLVITDWLLGDGTGGSMLQKANAAGALTDVGIIIFSSSIHAAVPPNLPNAVLVEKSCTVTELVGCVTRMLDSQFAEPPRVAQFAGASVTT